MKLSRNDGKVKGNKSARPRHHIYFPHEPITVAAEVAGIKTRLQEIAPFFDDNALDAARFIFGHTPVDIIWHEGSRMMIGIIIQSLRRLILMCFKKITNDTLQGCTKPL